MLSKFLAGGHIRTSCALSSVDPLYNRSEAFGKGEALRAAPRLFVRCRALSAHQANVIGNCRLVCLCISGSTSSICSRMVRSGTHLPSFAVRSLRLRFRRRSAARISSPTRTSATTLSCPPLPSLSCICASAHGIRAATVAATRSSCNLVVLMSSTKPSVCVCRVALPTSSFAAGLFTVGRLAFEMFAFGAARG